MSSGWEHQRIKNNELYRAARQRANVVEWQAGEQQALIEKALADGKVTKCPTGYYKHNSFSPFVGGLGVRTMDNLLPEYRAIAREKSGV
jgi:hypothetical protein